MIRKILKYAGIFILAGIVFALGLGVGPGLWNRWSRYPALEKEVLALGALRKEPPSFTSLNTYRGLLHAHS